MLFKNSSVNAVEERYEVKSFKFQSDIGNTHFCCWNQRGLYIDTSDRFLHPAPEHPQFRAASSSLPMQGSPNKN